jgi:hypothetical protein
MRKAASEILETAFAAHGEHLFSNSSVCLGLLKDYGGNDHPEVKLLADAVDQDFPRRLLDHGFVSTGLVAGFAREFAERRFYDADFCRWAIESWAVVLGLPHENAKSIAGIPSKAEQSQREQLDAERREKERLEAELRERLEARRRVREERERQEQSESGRPPAAPAYKLYNHQAVFLATFLGSPLAGAILMG